MIEYSKLGWFFFLLFWIFDLKLCRGSPSPRPSSAWTLWHTSVRPAKLEPNPQERSFCVEAFSSSLSYSQLPSLGVSVFLLPLRLLLPLSLALAQLSRVFMVLQTVWDIFSSHQVFSVFSVHRGQCLCSYVSQRRYRQAVAVTCVVSLHIWGSIKKDLLLHCLDPD